MANVFGFILTIYAWEHAFGLVSAFKKKPKQKKLQEDDDEAPEFKAKLKRDESRRRKQSQQMEVNHRCPSFMQHCDRLQVYYTTLLF